MKLIFYVVLISMHQSLLHIIGQYKSLIYISRINKKKSELLGKSECIDKCALFEVSYMLRH